jgi:hypothetical protein
MLSPAYSPTYRRAPGACACRNRLHKDLRLQRAIEHVHRCGPRASGELLVELLDHVGANPTVLDHVLKWLTLDPLLLSALRGDQFPTPPLHLVPGDDP